jgi:hypothetical protein
MDFRALFRQAVDAGASDIHLHGWQSTPAGGFLCRAIPPRGMLQSNGNASLAGEARQAFTSRLPTWVGRGREFCSSTPSPQLVPPDPEQSPTIPTPSHPVGSSDQLRQ